MVNFAVIKAGGKQYLVKENDVINVDKMKLPEKTKLNLETLVIFDEEGKLLKLGTPTLKEAVQAEILSHIKGEKIRVAKFKAKVRYRRVKGFRAQLTKLKIVKTK